MAHRVRDRMRCRGLGLDMIVRFGLLLVLDEPGSEIIDNIGLLRRAMAYLHIMAHEITIVFYKNNI